MKKNIKILYGVQGEGRGHASRSIHILNDLKNKGYDVQIFSGGEALPLLEDLDLPVKIIPLFRLHYGKRGISLVQTVFKNLTLSLGLLLRFGRKYKNVLSAVKAFQPDVIISDFEPYLCRIGGYLKIPVISLDHQHNVLTSEIPHLKKFSHKVKHRVFQFGIRLLYGNPEKMIVSSFYHFPKKAGSKAEFVGPFIPEEFNRMPKNRANDHVTIYLKEPAYINHIISSLNDKRETRFEVFSNWDRIEVGKSLPGNVSLHNIDRKRFLHSLVNAEALISTAGNQVIGEAAFLGIPVLAFPKKNDFEQEINGIALNESGFGCSLQLNEFNIHTLNVFLGDLPSYSENIQQFMSAESSYDGVERTINIIEQSIDEFLRSRQLIFDLSFGKVRLRYLRDLTGYKLNLIH
ncbi:MAG: glycosyltransferase family protein [candidate division KSB1 bacterium]|jgi:uncharacterized protein (TIGR00661 family)|nr:glycosyltransferase family protein [candidate division KSB1 bacterium]